MKRRSSTIDRGLPVPPNIDYRGLKEIFQEDSKPAQRRAKYHHIDMEKDKAKDRMSKLKCSARL